MAKYRPGDRVMVKGESGEGVGTYLGRDRESGHPVVRFDRVEAQDAQGRAVQHDNVSGYVPVQNLRRR